MIDRHDGKMRKCMNAKCRIHIMNDMDAMTRPQIMVQCCWVGTACVRCAVDMQKCIIRMYNCKIIEDQKCI